MGHRAKSVGRVRLGAQNRTRASCLAITPHYLAGDGRRCRYVRNLLTFSRPRRHGRARSSTTPAHQAPPTSGATPTLANFAEFIAAPTTKSYRVRTRLRVDVVIRDDALRNAESKTRPLIKRRREKAIFSTNTHPEGSKFLFLNVPHPTVDEILEIEGIRWMELMVPEKNP